MLEEMRDDVKQDRDSKIRMLDELIVEMRQKLIPSAAGPATSAASGPTTRPSVAAARTAHAPAAPAPARATPSSDAPPSPPKKGFFRVIRSLSEQVGLADLSLSFGEHAHAPKLPVSVSSLDVLIDAKGCWAHCSVKSRRDTAHFSPCFLHPCDFCTRIFRSGAATTPKHVAECGHPLCLSNSSLNYSECSRHWSNSVVVCELQAIGEETNATETA